MTEQAKTDTALVVLEPATAVTLFTEGQGIDALLADIKQQAASLVPDVATAKGRKEIASVAYAVAKTKTYLDGIGKELTDKYKEIPKRIDAHRKQIRDSLDTLKDQVRAPLTQYEEAEAARVADLQIRMVVFSDAKQASAEQASAELADLLTAIEAITIDESWQEFTAQAGVAKDAAVLHLRAVLTKAREREAQAAELDRLRQEAAAREQADRERRIAEQAAAAEAQRQEQARLDAERREREAKEREQQAIRDAEAADLARQQAEARRIADAEQAEQRRLQAAAQAKMEAELAAKAAAEQERQRMEYAQRQQAEAEAARAADVEHRRTINQQVLADLLRYGISESTAITLIKVVASNKIAHLTINY
ncbi:MAG: hypothetical protein ACRCWL_05775 [Aeromonas sp.]